MIKIADINEIKEIEIDCDGASCGECQYKEVIHKTGPSISHSFPVCNLFDDGGILATSPFGKIDRSSTCLFAEKLRNVIASEDVTDIILTPLHEQEIQSFRHIKKLFKFLMGTDHKLKLSDDDLKNDFFNG